MIYKLKDKLFQANIEPEEIEKLITKFKSQKKKFTPVDFIKYLIKVGYCVFTTELIELSFDNNARLKPKKLIKSGKKALQANIPY